MNLETAKSLLGLSDSDMRDDNVYKQKKKKALKKSHPDSPTGSHELFISTQESIKLIEQHISDLNNPPVYRNTIPRQSRETPNMKPAWKTRATHGGTFEDITLS